MGILDRLHKAVLGGYGALQAAPGLVKDLVTAPWDDEINGGIIGVTWRRSTHRLGQAASGVLGAEGIAGQAVGALPKAVRDPIRSVTKPILDGAEAVYREGIAEPITTAMTAASMMDAGHGVDLGKAYEIAQNRSPGQAIALAITTKDIFDDAEVEKAMGSDAYEVISGLSDAAMRMFLDPTVIGGEFLAGTRAAMLGRGAIKSADDINRALNSRGTTKFIQYIDDLAQTEFGRTPFKVDDEGLARKAGASEQVLRLIREKKRFEAQLANPKATQEWASKAKERLNKINKQLDDEWLNVYEASPSAAQTELWRPKGRGTLEIETERREALNGWNVKHPVQEGMTRLFRGDTPDGSGTAWSDVADATSEKLNFVDVPTADLDTFVRQDGQFVLPDGYQKKSSRVLIEPGTAADWVKKEGMTLTKGVERQLEDRKRFLQHKADKTPQEIDELNDITNQLNTGVLFPSDSPTSRIDKAGLANRIRDQFFPDHQHGGMISRVLADAAETGDVNDAVRTLLGDPEAAIRLNKRRADVAAQLARLEEGAADVERWGAIPMNADEAARLERTKMMVEREQQALYGEEARLARLDAAYARAVEAPRVSAMGEARQWAKSQTWLYQKGPLSAVLHKVFDMEPIRLVKLSDPTGDIQVARMLQKGPFDDLEKQNFRMQYGSALDAAQRQRILEAIEDHGWNKIASQLNPNQAKEFIQKARDSRTALQKMMNADRQYDGLGRSKVQVMNHATGKPMDIHLPLYVTQSDQVYHMTDWEAAKNAIDELEGYTKRFGTARQVPDAILERFYNIWKPSVLLRAGWPIRVVMDEQLRIAAKIGALALGGEQFHAAKKYITDRLDRVPKEERGSYYSHHVNSNRNYEIEGAFGTPGELENIWPAMVDARSAFRTTFITHEKAVADELRSGAFESKHFGKDLDYEDSWVKAVNGEIGGDPMARMILEGKTTEEIVKWMKSTPEGRSYQKTYPHRRDATNWVNAARAQVDSYVPDIGDLRQKVLERKARFEDLRRVVPDDELMPTIHGEVLRQAVGRSNVVDDMLTRTFDRLFTVLGSKPTNVLSRSKFFDHTYRLEAERVVNLMDEVAKRENRMLSADELNRAENMAREFAFGEMQKLLYNLAESSELATMLRHVSPFFMAWQETLTRWTGLAIERPAFVARMRQVWMAPEKAGLVVDEDGNQVEWDGNPDVEYGKDRYVIIPVHSDVRTNPDGSPRRGAARFVQGVAQMIPVIKEGQDLKLNKKSFNTVLQGAPGLGPPQQILLSEIMKDQPQLEDAMKLFMPYGPVTKYADSLLPTSLKRLGVATSGEDNKQYVATKLRIFNDMQIDYALTHDGDPNTVPANERPEPPSWEEAGRRAQDLWKMRLFASVLSPWQPQTQSPYQMYIDAYRKRMLVDPEGAFDWFVDTYGEEYVAATQSITKSMDGVNPTREGYAKRKEYQALIEENPELGGFVMGNEGAGEFSNSVYQMQMGSAIGPETDEKMRRQLTQAEVEAGPGKKLGWREYTRAMNMLDAELHQRKLPNYQVKAASDLRELKKQVIAKIAEKYPAWYEDLMDRDATKWQKRIAGMEKIATAPEMAHRNEMKGVREYLQARNQMLEVLQARKAMGGAIALNAASNYDLAQLWEAITKKITEGNLAFADTYYRWLEHDPLEVTA